MKSTVLPVKIHLTTFYGPTMTLSETFCAQIFMRRGRGVNIAPETLTILNFFQRWWMVIFFTHLDISFDVWGNRVIFVNFWLSRVNLQLPDKGTHDKICLTLRAISVTACFFMSPLQRARGSIIPKNQNTTVVLPQFLSFPLPQNSSHWITILETTFWRHTKVFLWHVQTSPSSLMSAHS